MTISARIGLLLGLFASLPAQAAITIDLSYVDQNSVEFARFKNFVEDAVAGNPDYGFSAADAAYMYKLTGQAQYAKLAAGCIQWHRELRRGIERGQDLCKRLPLNAAHSTRLNVTTSTSRNAGCAGSTATTAVTP
jgi:hypothetical protein